MDVELPSSTCPNCERLAREFADYKAQSEKRIAFLEAKIEELTRRGSRQAAPFRKQETPLKKAKKPGRKKGSRHGDHSHRAVPERIDEVITVELPKCCPHCQATDVESTDTKVQYQTDIPQTIIVRQFNIEVGECGSCGKAVRGRHELQTSNATDAAGSQFGPNVHATITVMNKELGLSHGKCKRLLMMMFPELKISRGTVYQSMERTAKRLEKADQKLRDEAKEAVTAIPDETGWRCGGRPAWLHAAVLKFADQRGRSVIYHIDETRSSKPIIELLGEEWSGTSTHDGCRIYNKLKNAKHQQCMQHLIRRCREVGSIALGSAKNLSSQILDLINRAFSIRRAGRGHRMDIFARIKATAQIGRELEEIVSRNYQWKPNRILAKYMASYDWLVWFGFAIDLDREATNSLAEQAIRPAVVNRKVWGGNRTILGAKVQSILMTCIQTCKARLIEPFEVIKSALFSTKTIIIPNLR
jgi:transposase